MTSPQHAHYILYPITASLLMATFSHSCFWWFCFLVICMKLRRKIDILWTVILPFSVSFLSRERCFGKHRTQHLLFPILCEESQRGGCGKDGFVVSQLRGETTCCLPLAQLYQIIPPRVKHLHCRQTPLRPAPLMGKAIHTLVPEPFYQVRTWQV